jgi:hypothetical protein
MAVAFTRLPVEMAAALVRAAAVTESRHSEGERKPEGAREKQPIHVVSPLASRL